MFHVQSCKILSRQATSNHLKQAAEEIIELDFSLAILVL